MTYNDIVQKVANDLELPVDLVENTVKAYWRFIKDSIQALPLKDDLTDEEFNNLKVNFNIPSIGKLSCTLDRYKNIKKRFEYIKKLREND